MFEYIPHGFAEVFGVSAMQLAFATRSIRSICEEELEAEKQLGVKVARLLRQRLADLSAAKTISDLPPTLRGVHHGDDGEHLRLSLDGTTWILLGANHNDNPVAKSGRIDWSRVTRVQILGFEVRHG